MNKETVALIITIILITVVWAYITFKIIFSDFTKTIEAKTINKNKGVAYQNYQ